MLFEGNYDVDDDGGGDDASWLIEFHSSHLILCEVHRVRNRTWGLLLRMSRTYNVPLDYLSPDKPPRYCSPGNHGTYGSSNCDQHGPPAPASLHRRGARRSGKNLVSGVPITTEHKISNISRILSEPNLWRWLILFSEAGDVSKLGSASAPVFAEQRGRSCDPPQCSAITETPFMAFLKLYANV